MDVVTPRATAYQPGAELAQAVGLDVAAWWKPTAEGYFRHVSKAVILETMGQFAPAHVTRLAKLKKADIASEAERLGDLGFGGEAQQAMQQRADFLTEQGLAERRGQRVILARNLLGTLRNRELMQAAKGIAAEAGLEHRPAADGQRVTGIYRRSVLLASGRYAMLEDGMGFSLVPWKPVIEQRLGQQLATTVRGDGVSWAIGRQRGRSIG